MKYSAWQHLNTLAEDFCCDDLSTQQESYLLQMLSANQHTIFGKQHQFHDIRSIDQYQQNVPLHTYEDLLPFIEVLQSGQDNVLFAGKPTAYEKTGGSHSGGKLIPYTAAGLVDFRKSILPWLGNIVRANQITSGSLYWALSPALPQTDKNIDGIPVGGGDALYLGEQLAPALASLSAVPYWVGDLSDFKQWQLATLYHLLTRVDLVFVSVWSPSFFLRLIEGISECAEQLDILLKEGGYIQAHKLPPDLAAARRLNAYLSHHQVAKLWPQLKIISCWGDVSALIGMRQLHKLFPDITIEKKGLLSTEAVVTVPNQNHHNVLAYQSGFFEFLDEQHHLYFGSQLTAGKRYHVVTTTTSGLYRYQTQDIVLCQGYDSGLPILQFQGRGQVVCDLVGEKLTEIFVADCLQKACDAFCFLCPNQEANGYLLFAEQPLSLAQLEGLENSLNENPQYHYARRLGQLQPIQQCTFPVLQSYYFQQVQQKKQQRLGDIKTPTLLYAFPDWLDFEV